MCARGATSVADGWELGRLPACLGTVAPWGARLGKAAPLAARPGTAATSCRSLSSRKGRQQRLLQMSRAGGRRQGRLKSQRRWQGLVELRRMRPDEESPHLGHRLTDAGHHVAEVEDGRCQLLRHHGHQR